jgi:hypothetical protein
MKWLYSHKIDGLFSVNRPVQEPWTTPAEPTLGGGRYCNPTNVGLIFVPSSVNDNPHVCVDSRVRWGRAGSRIQATVNNL